MTVPLPLNFKPPTHIDLYDDTINLQDHLKSFWAFMLFSGVSNPIMCRVLSITLKKIRLQWFTTLPTQLVSCFKQLVKASNIHFATRHAPRKTSTTLANFQQGGREMLLEYLAHFKTLALEIRDLNEWIIVHQITTELRTGHFSLSLAKKPATSLVDLLTHSKKYINVEEVEMA